MGSSVKRCKVGALLDKGTPLSPADAGTLTGVLGQPERYPATVLAQALTLEGHPVAPTTVKDHRGHRCACTRERTAA